MILRYPRAVLAADYLRAAFGAAACMTPLALGAAPMPVTALCLAGLGLFAAYAAGTFGRQRLRLRVDEDGVAGFGRGGALAWSEIERVRLAYYSVRRDGRDGWMELRVNGNGRCLRIDSRLEGFAGVAERAARAALARGAVLDPATSDNLARLGTVGRPASEHLGGAVS